MEHFLTIEPGNSPKNKFGERIRLIAREAVKRVALLPGYLRVVFFVATSVFLLSSFGIIAKFNERYLIEVPSKGGSITEGIIGRPRFINPIIAKSDADRDLAALIYSGLLRANMDSTYKPDLAEQYTISEDGLTYTFTLRENLFWHDGKPVTSEDVVFTIDKVRDPNLAIKSPKRAAWEGVEVSAVDARTIVFKIKQPFAPFLDNATLGIIPKHIWQSVPDEEFDVAFYNIEPIGSGPYRVTHIERDTTKGIPRWYDLTAFRHFPLGEPYVTDIRIMFFGNNKELTEAYADGSVDQIPTVEPAYANELSDKGVQLLSIPLPRVFVSFFNQNQQPIFADVAVRKALELSVDKQRIVDTALFGHGRPVIGPFPENNKTTSATTSLIERITEAQVVLEKAGWTRNVSGVYEKTDKKKKAVVLLEFSISVPDIPELRKSAEILKEDWEKLGAAVTLKVFEQTTFASDVLTPRKFDVLFYGQIYNRTPDPYVYWHSSQRNSPGLNIAMYANKNADKLLEDIRRTTNTEERRILLDKFATEIHKDIPAIFVYSPNFLYATANDVRGISVGLPTTESDRFLSISDWFVSSERVWKWFADRHTR